MQKNARELGPPMYFLADPPDVITDVLAMAIASCAALFDTLTPARPLLTATRES